MAQTGDGAEDTSELIPLDGDVDDLDVDIKSEAAFARYKVELANKAMVEREKEADEARKAFREQEQARLWEHKQELHRKTGEEFGHTKQTVEEVRQANRQKAVEYKQELELMRETVRNQSEDWAQFG